MSIRDAAKIDKNFDIPSAISKDGLAFYDACELGVYGGEFKDGKFRRMDAQRAAVQCAPDHEVPGRAVPKAADDHGRKQIQIGAMFSFSIAPQGDIQIFLQPGRQRNVPALPQLCNIVGQIWEIEVSGQVDIQHFCHTDSHVRIARKIKIDLQGIC